MKYWTLRISGGKALTLIFTSGGIREGAIPFLRVSDYSHVKKQGHLVAGRLKVYSGDPEVYVTFITPEACTALDITEGLVSILPGVNADDFVKKPVGREYFVTKIRDALEGNANNHIASRNA